MPALARRPGSRAALRGWPGTLAAALLLTLPRPHGACDLPPRYESMKIKGDSKSSYNPGDRVDYECRPGYKRNFKLPAHTVCNDDGTWTALQEACTKKACPHPPVPSNGEISSTKGNLEFGSEVHYACFVGFRLIGPKVILCLLVDNTVNWSDQPPLCEKVLCRPPEKIPNGKYSNSHKEVFEYGEVVTYTCNPSAGRDEYSLIGTKKRVCSGDGDWTGTPPRCEVVKCPYPVVPNGMPRSIIPNKRYYNTTVLFDCLPGFVLRGSDIIRCDADSSWKPAVPTCVPGSDPSVNILIQASGDPSTNRTAATAARTSGHPGPNRTAATVAPTPGRPGPNRTAATAAPTPGRPGANRTAATAAPTPGRPGANRTAATAAPTPGHPGPNRTAATAAPTSGKPGPNQTAATAGPTSGRPGPNQTAATVIPSLGQPGSKPKPTSKTPTSGEPGDARPSDTPSKTFWYLGIICILITHMARP